MDALAYQLTDLRVEFAGRPVLDIGSLAIPRGGVTAIVGPNGAGKTTALRVLAFLQAPSAGRLEFDGRPVTFRNRDLVALRRHVTLVAQSPLLFRRTVGANVAFGMRARGVASHERVESALAAVGLVGFGARAARKLSGGEAQRVAIARALAIDPGVYLFDEPTANVDREHVGTLERLLVQLGVEGKAVVMTTHNIEQAFRLTDTVVSLVGGRIAPVPLVNLLRGTSRSIGGTNYFHSEGMRIEIATGAAPAAIAIDPEDIIISRAPLHSSARNSFPGYVTKVESDGASIMLTVACGRNLVARITRHSYEELALNVGTAVYVTFKSTAVHALDSRPS
ncbi:MAG: ABC transporter ATP-binding protein [Candidatus Binatia bacterium]